MGSEHPKAADIMECWMLVSDVQIHDVCITKSEADESYHDLVSILSKRDHACYNLRMIHMVPSVRVTITEAR